MKDIKLILLIILMYCLSSCVLQGDKNYTSDEEDDDTEVNVELDLDDIEKGDFTDVDWESLSSTSIVLNGNSITYTGSGVSISGTSATITSAGTYVVTGTLNDGQIIVDTEDEDEVRLVLDNANITCSDSAPIFIKDTEQAILVLSDNSSNYITDGSTYVYSSSDEDEPDAAIFSKSDLIMYGDGTLTVKGNYNEAIKCKDGLIIQTGTYNITAEDTGIIGKDYLVINGSNITITSDGDGLKSNNDNDTTRGYIYVEDADITITSDNDALQAETYVVINSGTINVESGGGSSVSDNTSSKGIKAYGIVIDGGTFNLDCADDGIHAEEIATINDGSFTIASGDDGIHSGNEMEINGGTINITTSYEGLESGTLTINDGYICLESSDDGINVGGGADSSGMMGAGGARPGEETFETNVDYFLYINGGYVYVNAVGDGLDANGAIEMTGGTVIVNGPIEDMNGPLDYDAYFTITGGFLVAVGSSGMAQSPSTTSSQNSLLVKLNSTYSANTLLSIKNSSGTELITFAPAKRYASVVFSSPDLVNGSYGLYFGGSSTGTETNGLYENGTYSGTKYTDFTVNSIVTTIR